MILRYFYLKNQVNSFTDNFEMKKSYQCTKVLNQNHLVDSCDEVYELCYFF